MLIPRLVSVLIFCLNNCDVVSLLVLVVEYLDCRRERDKRCAQSQSSKIDFEVMETFQSIAAPLTETGEHRSATDYI